jgi:hypothetical protein
MYYSCHLVTLRARFYFFASIITAVVIIIMFFCCLARRKLYKTTYETSLSHSIKRNACRRLVMYADAAQSRPSAET